MVGRSGGMTKGDQSIERRSRKKDPEEESELWRGSVRAYEEKR